MVWVRFRFRFRVLGHMVRSNQQTNSFLFSCVKMVNQCCRMVSYLLWKNNRSLRTSLSQEPITSLLKCPARLMGSYQMRNIDLSAIRMTLHCDTHALVQQLQLRGFTEAQAEGITEALVEIVNSTLEQQAKDMVTKAQQEILIQQLTAEIAALRKDMIILEKSEFSNLRHITDQQSREILQLKAQIKDEVSKLQGQITLDINLEKSRSKEVFSTQETQISNLHNKIETKIADMRTTFEQHRNDVLKFAGGTIFSCLTVCLGFYRLWS